MKDKEKKDIYDKYGEEGLRGGMGGGDPFDIFDILTGGRGRRQEPKGPMKTETIKQYLEVTLEELYNGATKKIRVKRKRLCGTCGGIGGTSKDAVQKCSKCNGAGYVIQIAQVAPGFVTQMKNTCPQCQGAGEQIDKKKKCKTCDGRKVVDEEKNLEVSVDLGMKNGQKIVMEGEADEAPGYKAGDIIFILQEVPHKDFKRVDSHLYMTKKISLTEALTGFEFIVKHLDGRKLLVKSKPGQVIKPNEVMQISGEGMPTYGSPFDKGNLLIKFEIEFPKKLDDKIVDRLIQILPQTKAPMEKTEGKATKVELEEVKDSEGSSQNRARGGMGGHYEQRGDAYMEDDEEEEEDGPQHVSCGQQ